MIDENFLINDEHSAINGYNEYLKQGVKNPKIIPIIKSIIKDEQKHIRLLNKIKKIKTSH
jgi:rubrerythrin